jgi:hypothetical protein
LEQDPCKRFFTIYGIVQQILVAVTDFGRNASFNHEKVQGSESIRYIETPGSSYICTKRVGLFSSHAGSIHLFMKTSICNIFCFGANVTENEASCRSVTFLCLNQQENVL